MKKILPILAFLFGIALGYLLIYKNAAHPLIPVSSEKMGFLPYWLSGRAKKDYSNYLNDLAYFSLTVDTDGSIKKLTNPTEEDPGWNSLTSGKMNVFFDNAKKNNQQLSLVIFNGDNSNIGLLLSDPVTHADQLVKDTLPLMKRFGFKDLNLDIEYIDVASKEARTSFTSFVSEIRKTVNKSYGLTLSLDISPSAFIKNYLINPREINKYVDSIIIMGYDYHFQGSLVTGPVAPLFGASTIAEFDIDTALKKALQIIPAQKIILGAPLYGYEWETIDNSPRSPVIPGTGLTASSLRVEDLLKNCSTCSAQFDNVAKEKYVIYKDGESGSYHQIFYPDQETMESKIQIAQKYNLGGIALWALGYEDSRILNPLSNY